MTKFKETVYIQTASWLNYMAMNGNLPSKIGIIRQMEKKYRKLDPKKSLNKYEFDKYDNIMTRVSEKVKELVGEGEWSADILSLLMMSYCLEELELDFFRINVGHVNFMEVISEMETSDHAKEWTKQGHKIISAIVDTIEKEA